MLPVKFKFKFIFDTESNGLPLSDKSKPIGVRFNNIRMLQIGFSSFSQIGSKCDIISEKQYIIKPKNFSQKSRDLVSESSIINNITLEDIDSKGVPLESILEELYHDILRSSLVIGHNLKFDIELLQIELFQLKTPSAIKIIELLCLRDTYDTMIQGTILCQLSYKNFKDYKYPSLQELHIKLTGHKFEKSHDALNDVKATRTCYFLMNGFNSS